MRPRRPNCRPPRPFTIWRTTRKTAGLAPNIDTLRARVQLQAQQEVAHPGPERPREAAHRSCARDRPAGAAEISPGQSRSLRSRCPTSISPAPTISLCTTRSDYKADPGASACGRVAPLRSLEGLSAVGRSLSGTYGVLGYTPDAMAPNYTAAATLNIPIFQGGKVQADVQEADAVLKERQAQADNLKGAYRTGSGRFHPRSEGRCSSRWRLPRSASTSRSRRSNSRRTALPQA